MTKHDRKQKNELKVFISSRESRCDECGENLGHDAWILLQGDDKGAACLSCADLDHLVFLPSGDAARVRELYPNCPIGREKVIAEHACRKYSERVGRSAAAKELDKEAVCLAVAAHVRHQETNYDELLLSDFERWQAREQVHAQVSHVLAEWQSTTS